jgi:hypothetical protein
MQEFVVPRSMPRILLMMCGVGEKVKLDDFGVLSLARAVPAWAEDFYRVGYQCITKIPPAARTSKTR